MLCPVCRKQMLILEYHDVEIDHCADCGGVWLDQGELELIAETEGEELPPFELETTRKTRRRCPRCNRKMKEGTFPGTRVDVDACQHDHGIWFDKGELEEILLKRGQGAVAQKLAEYFGSIFGSEIGEPQHTGSENSGKQEVTS